MNLRWIDSDGLILRWIDSDGLNLRWIDSDGLIRLVHINEHERGAGRGLLREGLVE